MTTFKLPDLGEGLHEAEIVAWHVAVGDRVVADQPLVSVETSKAVVEIPVPWAGRIAQTFGAPGEVVAVGAALVEIDSEGATRDAGSVVGRLPTSPSAPPPSLERAPPLVAEGLVKASPAVRKLAAELGVDLSKIIGSGPGGVATCEDVERATTAAPSDKLGLPLRGVRRAMADSMARAGAAVVPATITDEAIIDGWTASVDPTIRLIRAMAAGCRAAPQLNAWLLGTPLALRQHEVVDLAIAMETEDGLFAPVLRNIAQRGDADLRSGLEIMKRDVQRRSVPLAELRDPTITLSNFGMLGGLHAALIIVPPQVAIVGAGRIHSAPRAISSEIRIVRVLPLSLTFDHRGVTGAEAIRFLNAVIADLQKPEMPSLGDQHAVRAAL